ncbi:MAG: hypothetical protein JXB06_05390 [Spirochaetales bacterium]|nr:hypothetical protein [Spirochaetales bacterium]
MGDIVPRNQLVKQGVQGIAGVGGGVGLLILRAIAAIGEKAFSVPGLIVGGVVTVAGLVIMSSPEDRTAGMVTIGAGALTLAASLPLIGGIANAFMWIGGFGLIIAGGISLFRFLRNLRRRSR